MLVTMLPRVAGILIICGALLSAACALPCAAQASQHANAPLLAGNLGRAYVAVDGPWAFRPGDNPAFAAADFDDSQWARIQVDRSWEGQGFKNLTGYAWYRRRIAIEEAEKNADWQLALTLPAIQGAAEIYWNGRLVGTYGKLPPDALWYDQSNGTVTEISPHLPAFVPLGKPQSGVLAIRIWKAPHIFFSLPEEGGLIETPLLGSAKALADRNQAAWYAWLRSNLWQLGLGLLCTVVSLLALLAWLRQRRQTMLLWLALYMSHPLPMLVFSGAPGFLSFHWNYGLIAPVVCIEDVSLWFLLLYLLGLRDNRRLVRWTWWVVAVAIVGNYGDGALQLFDWTTWPGQLFLWLDAGFTIPSLLVEIWGVILVIFAFRRRLDAERWLLAIVAMLADLFQAFGNWFNAGGRWTHWTFWRPLQQPLFSIAGNQFDIAAVLNTLLLIAITFAAWRFQTEQTRRQSRRDEEFRNAQQVQEVLIPLELPRLPGFSIDAIYKPAGQVGGDFYQIIETAQGGVLAVIGDVSGKGMPAAMTVALLVGTVRTLAHYTQSPGEILAAMNLRMLRRTQGGFTTCLVLRADVDGTLTVANAGHIAPYLNGIELVVESGLPLGLAAATTYAEAVFTLPPSTQLTLVTDGVVEARNSAGELFGFDNTAAVSCESADRIAKTAELFGQDDDITVLTVNRQAVVAS
jgi:hypothetical protein